MSGVASGAQGGFDPGAPGSPAALGPYRLYGLIARGGMAEVYRARAVDEPEGPRMLAIKVMRPQLAREMRFVEMFVHEGRLAMMLAHEAIVRTLDVGQVDGRYYIAMEYIGGRDLTQVLKRCQDTGQRIPVPHALHVALSMCDGLGFAHALTDPEGRPLNIVNRDVSPSNVRLGYDGRVKLLDFGIAQAMLQLTSEIGVLKGKLSYMSPEQVRGMPLDARTDLFSTGIVLHEMLTTEKLFRGDTEFALMERVRSGEVLPPSKFNRRVSPELDQVVLKALSRDPAERFQRAADFRAALAPLLERYRFQPREMAEFLRGLFRADYVAEEAEQAACDLGGASNAAPLGQAPAPMPSPTAPAVAEVRPLSPSGPPPPPSSGGDRTSSPSARTVEVPAAVVPRRPARVEVHPLDDATQPAVRRKITE